VTAVGFAIPAEREFRMARLFSKRKQPPPDQFRSDIPLIVRKRIWAAMQELCDSRGFLAVLGELESTLLKEYGELSVARTHETKHHEELVEHYLSCKDDHFLDLLELIFNVDYLVAADAVAAINDILRDAAVGYELSPFVVHETQSKSDPDSWGAGAVTHHYEYELPQVLVKSSDLLHTDAVVPALQLLSEARYKGANEEFLKAHEHHRFGRYPECLNECLKAFESTMKIICDKKRWKYQQTDTAAKLIKACLEKGLVPTFSDQQLTSLRTLLESGVPTVRNKRSGHGQGVESNDVPAHLARYALHLTAASILLLAECAR
jgi:hypothetical protein